MELPKSIAHHKETILCIKYSMLLVEAYKNLLRATPDLNQDVFTLLDNPHSFSKDCWDLHEFESFCYLLEHNLTEEHIKELPSLKDKVKALELLNRLTLKNY